jgi:hypothetical protein
LIAEGSSGVVKQLLEEGLMVSVHLCLLWRNTLSSSGVPLSLAPSVLRHVACWDLWHVEWLAAIFLRLRALLLLDLRSTNDLEAAISLSDPPLLMPAVQNIRRSIVLTLLLLEL